jgi:hypothetical protein
MAGFIQNLIWNSVEGFVEAGMKTGGEYAGNALIKAGDAIENGGRGVGNSIEAKATNYGTKISGQTYKPNPQALPSTARKPAMKRSNSTPASNKPTTSGAKGGSSVPIGGKKYPGTNQVNGAVGAGKKVVGRGVGTAKSTVGGVTGTARSTVGGVTGNASRVTGGVVGGGQKALGGVTGNASKTVNGTLAGGQKALGGVTGGVVGGGQKALGGVTSNASKTLGSTVGGGQKALGGATKSIPPFKGSPAGSFPSGKNAPAKPGMPKPFTPPIEQKKPDAKKPYPGTNTLPGQGSRVPVQQQKYKPAEPYKPQIGEGQKMKHIAV